MGAWECQRKPKSVTEDKSEFEECHGLVIQEGKPNIHMYLLSL